MKTFVVFLLIAVTISAGLTFFLLAEHQEIDPVRKQYAQVFSTFEKNADAIAHQFNTYGLDILQRHQIEGLRVLKQYPALIQALQSYLDAETIFFLCRDHGPQLEQLLHLFQPDVVADIHLRFGAEGFQYLLAEPERYFLLREYGDRIIQMAKTRGPIIFDIVKKHPPEFLELYYDDALFKTVARFGAEGLMALKRYRGMAATLFSIFAENNRFAAILETYGYQQIIPVVYYFYQTKSSFRTIVTHLAKFDLHTLFQADTADRETSSTQDQGAAEHEQIDRATWAVNRIYESGNTFLRQFSISENGEVTPLEFVVLTNMLEVLMVGEPGGNTEKISSLGESGSDKQNGLTCGQLTSALDLLGILPYETVFSRQARCLHLRAGLAEVTSLQQVEGLLALDEREDLVARYGYASVPFISKYGREGLQLLEQTDGKILALEATYGERFVYYTMKYGGDVQTLVETFGEPMVNAIRDTDGMVIPYATTYGKEIFPVLAQPEGKELFALTPVFGEDLVRYATKHPTDFPRYLIKYGEVSLTALRDFDDAPVVLARKYGDDMIWYIGRYGEQAMQIAGKGQAGITLLRAIPEELWEKRGKILFQYGLPGVYFALLINHPQKFNHYIGLLGAELLPVPPALIQLTFWTIIFLLLLAVIYGGYKFLIRFRE